MPISNRPLVSVIIPAYNAGKHIDQTIHSVLSQTYSHLEIIIVNDGSTDNTAEILQKYQSDNRFKVVHQPNAGCSAAKNTGLAQVTGEYIQYLDADDLLSADKIQEQVEALEGKPFQLAVCRTVVFDQVIDDSNGHEIDTDFLYTTDKPFEFLMNLYGLNGKQGMIQPNAFLLSRQLSDAIGKWDTTISPAPDEDGEYFCRAMLASAGIVYTQKGINYYRKQQGNGSLSKQISMLHAKGGLLSLILKANHILKKEDSKKIRQVLARHYAEFIYVYASQYAELCKQAESEIHKLGIKKIPAVGGRYFKSIAGLIGFENAISAKNFLKEFQLKVPIALMRRQAPFRVHAK